MSSYVDDSDCENDQSVAWIAVFLSSYFFPICVEFGSRCVGSASEQEREAIINAAAIAVNRKWLPLTIYSDCNMIVEGVHGLRSYVHIPLLRITDRLSLVCKKYSVMVAWCPRISN